MSESLFRPLDFIREVMADADLNSSEKLALVAMAMGTDNASFKVRRSLGALARSMSHDRKNLGKIIERPHVARYFARVERPSARRVDIWLEQVPGPCLWASGLEASGLYQESTATAPEVSLWASDPKAIGLRPQGYGPEAAPSASISPSLPSIGNATAEGREGHLSRPSELGVPSQEGFSPEGDEKPNAWEAAAIERARQAREAGIAS